VDSQLSPRVEAFQAIDRPRRQQINSVGRVPLIYECGRRASAARPLLTIRRDLVAGQRAAGLASYLRFSSAKTLDTRSDRSFALRLATLMSSERCNSLRTSRSVIGTAPSKQLS